jgi:ABC-type dipeptide/oligopeptide/nickel transport system permease subunit
MAMFGMLARGFLGTVLGMIAGWWQNSWMDRTIQGLISVWAAFPVTLFAMILILGIGIQHGMGVFILTICLVGWGEIAQTVRAEVISQKPSQHIEAARALGAGSSTILFRHMLPHLWKSLLVSSMLEMAAVLMLLAELGYLNIFLGGGFKVEISAKLITLTRMCRSGVRCLPMFRGGGGPTPGWHGHGRLFLCFLSWHSISWARAAKIPG